MEKGIEKRNLEVARNLLDLGLEIDKIAKAIGLTKDEIKRIMN